MPRKAPVPTAQDLSHSPKPSDKPKHNYVRENKIKAIDNDYEIKTILETEKVPRSKVEALARE